MKDLIDPLRLLASIDELAKFSESAEPAVTRILFTPEDLAARDWLQEQTKELGLVLRMDPVGNMFFRWIGSDLSLSAVASGSHIDAIPNAGRYDGVLGVLGVLEAFRALRAAGFQPKRSLDLILFTAEEPTRFGLGCLGSRLLSGTLLPDQARALRDKEGRTLTDWLAQMKWNTADNGDGLETVSLVGKPCYHAFVELHIEQGPLLETQGFDIGVVEKIAAPSAFRYLLDGQGGHAGGVLMPGRRDALLAGCEIALAVEGAALQSGSPDTVGTTGIFEIKPGAINSIPSKARLEIDFRDTNVTARSKALAEIQAATEAICRKRNIDFEYQQINLDPPAVADPTLVQLVLEQADRSNFKAHRMISRAYHDSLFMALLCPTTMIFIPCRNGVSHRPDEYSTPEQMKAGVAVLAATLQKLSA